MDTLTVHGACIQLRSYAGDACMVQEQSHRAVTRLSSSVVKADSARGQLAANAACPGTSGTQMASAARRSQPGCAETPQAAMTLASLGRGLLFTSDASAPSRYAVYHEKGDVGAPTQALSETMHVLKR